MYILCISKKKYGGGNDVAIKGGGGKSLGKESEFAQ